MHLKSLSVFFYPFYKAFRNRRSIAFTYLHIRWFGYARFKRINNIKFLGYKFDIPDAPSFLTQCQELFVNEIYRFSSKTREPVIFDCGANVGVSCIYFKTLYPGARIKAFEADSNIANYLKNNLSSNGILDVEVIDSAVWIHNEGVDFSFEGSDGGSICGDTNSSIVQSVRLKDLLESEQFVDLLKMDIEGAEYEVLKDCRDALENVNNIFVEYHSWNGTPQNLSDILHILEQSGFRYYISSINEREVPFINHGLEENMDLQLNIFGVRK